MVNSQRIKEDQAEAALFARLATEPKLREWLEKMLQGEYDIFVSTMDKDYLAKSQGRAGLLRLLLKKLDDAKNAS